MTSSHRRSLITSVAVLLLVVRALSSHADQRYGEVELVRDKFGTPHVFAETDEGAMFGLGYACAEDRGFQMHYSLRIIQGRAAEVLGSVTKVNRDTTTLESDRKMRAFGFARAADRVVENLDAESRAISDEKNQIAMTTPFRSAR